MSERIRCFFLEPTGQTQVYLRRYHSRASDDAPCPLPAKYHNAMNPFIIEPEERDKQGYICNGLKPVPVHDDPRWPTHCACGYAFTESDEWQRFTDSIYRRTDTCETMTLRDAPAGAMWEAWWVDQFIVPQGEHSLIVRTPGGDWEIDSQASNCTMPEDGRQEKHHCWIRHGTPPDITVDKNGITCGAGAGSIQCGDYHGFLREGYLES